MVRMKLNIKTIKEKNPQQSSNHFSAILKESHQESQRSPLSKQRNCCLQILQSALEFPLKVASERTIGLCCMTHTAKKNVNMHNIVSNIKFWDESFYLQHWQMNKSSELGMGGRGKDWYKKQEKNQLIGKVNAVPNLEMKRKKKEK